MRHPYVAGFFSVLALGSGVAMAAKIGSGGTGGGASVDVLAALVGKDVNSNSYTATTTTGPAFFSTGDLVNAVRLGTPPRATIGTCQAGGVCIGPDDFGFTTKLYVWGDITTQTVVARTFIDVQGSSYLINNDGPLRVADTDGLVINSTTPLKGRVAVSVTFDSASISNNNCNPQTVTVPGAVLNDFVSVNANFALPQGVGIQGARVTATDTVELNLCNNTTGGALDPVSGPYLFKLER